MRLPARPGAWLVGLILLLGVLIPPVRDGIFWFSISQAVAITHGRPLAGYPPDQLAAMDVDKAQRILELRGRLSAAQAPGEVDKLRQSLWKLRVELGEVRQERAVLAVYHHPLQAGLVFLAGLACLAIGLGLLAQRRVRVEKAARANFWQTLEPPPSEQPKVLQVPPGLESPDLSKRVVGVSRKVSPLLETDALVPLSIAAASQEAAALAAEERAGLGGGKPPIEGLGSLPSLELPPLPETLKEQEGAEEPAGVFVDPALVPPMPGWAAVAREPMDPQQVAQLVALFVSDGSRDYVGLLGFLSHQAALAGLFRVRLASGRRGVQLFFSTPTREQSVGILPADRYAHLVADLSARLQLDRHSILQIVPGLQGYQLQEVRLEADAVVIERRGEGYFLPEAYR